jgi:hypothetical protein
MDEERTVMKEFEYYTTPKARYYEYEEYERIRSEITEKINNTPMTAKDREDALKNAKKEANDKYEKLNQPYKDELVELRREFESDARKELNLEKLLTPAGITILERQAYEDAHSYGIQAVYECMQKYVDFLIEIRGEMRNDSK